MPHQFGCVRILSFLVCAAAGEEPLIDHCQRRGGAKGPQVEAGRSLASFFPYVRPRFSYISPTSVFVQTKLKISGAKFLSRAPEIKIDIQGNILSGKPREFSSGARGWYLGGKIPLKVDGMTIWAQAGINIVIPGANEWK